MPDGCQQRFDRIDEKLEAIHAPEKENHMNLKCLVGMHEWNGCKCSKCDKARDDGHDWSKDCEECAICGQTRPWTHNWSKDCEECAICGQTRTWAHNWNGCRCLTCNKTRDREHDWSEDCQKCAKCGKTQTAKHAWNGCRCSKCKKTRNKEHDWSAADCEKCSICGTTRLGAHDWSTDYKKCSTCGKTRQRYVDNGNGTVTDNATELMWTKNANHGSMNWYDSAKYCDNLKLAGYRDWRLPGVGFAELNTLFRKNGNPFGAWEGTAGTPFTDIQSLYWSRSAPTDSAHSVDMTDGGIKLDHKICSKYVWPVRGANIRPLW